MTVVVPRAGHVHENSVFAGFHSFNGCGEMTGTTWIEELGLLMSPIALTDTTQVGLVKDALIQYALERRGKGSHFLGVVAETWGGWLNDRDAFHLTREHVFQALDSATGGPVPEGNVGGGTPMICYDLKGGIGTASWVAEAGATSYTVGVLVQANQGEREQLRVDGVPLGRQSASTRCLHLGRTPATAAGRSRGRDRWWASSPRMRPSFRYSANAWRAAQ